MGNLGKKHTKDPNSPRMKAAAERREHIRATAARLFSEHGYEVVGMRTIAKAAGCSTGAIFGYWPDKASLFESALARKPIDERTGVMYLGALFEIRRAMRDPGGPDLKHIEHVLDRVRLDDPTV